MKLYLTVTFSRSEASPDFNSKKLPYLPYLPPSVQSGCLSPVSPYRDIFDTDDEGNNVTDITSVVTDDLPSLYSVPHKLRSESRSGRMNECVSHSKQCISEG